MTDLVRHSILSVRSRALFVFFVTNLLPLAGLLYWKWNLVSLQALYWLEIGIMLFWTSVRGMFAERVFDFKMRERVNIRFDGFNNKLGGVRFVDGLPPLYPRNFPSLAMNVSIIGGFSLLFGFFILDFGVPGWREVVQPTAVSVVVVALVAFIARGLTVYVFLAERQYETCSVAPLNRQLLEYVGVVGFFIWVATTDTDTSATLFGLLVGTKFVYELLRHRPGTLHTWDNPITRFFGIVPNFPGPDRLDSPTGDPTTEASPDLQTVFLAGIPPAAFNSLMVPYWVLFIILSIVNILVIVESGVMFGPNIWILIPMGIVTIYVFLTFFPLKLAEYIVQYGPMSYRIYDEEIVGYDWWLDEPQWRVSFDGISDVSRRAKFTDRFLGTRTIDLETENGRELSLAHLSDTDTIYDQLRYVN